MSELPLLPEAREFVSSQNPPWAVTAEWMNGWNEARYHMHLRAAVEAAQPEAARPVVEPTDADWADFGAWAERDKGAMDMLGKLIDVWDDGQLPYEHRCYVDGAWAELIAEARALLASALTIQPTQPVQEAVPAKWRELLTEIADSCAGYEVRVGKKVNGDWLARARELLAATPAQAGDAGEPSDGERLTFEADPELTPAAFAERLARHMKVASLTAKEVSELTGVSETTLSRLKNHGRMPDAISYAALCNFMGWHPHIRHRLAIRATKGGKL